MLVVKLAPPKHSKYRGAHFDARKLRPSYASSLVPNMVIRSKNVVRSGSDDKDLDSFRDTSFDDFFKTLHVDLTPVNMTEKMPGQSNQLDDLLSQEPQTPLESATFGSPLSLQISPPFMQDLLQGSSVCSYQESYQESFDTFSEMSLNTSISTDDINRVEFPFLQTLSPTETLPSSSLKSPVKQKQYKFFASPYNKKPEAPKPKPLPNLNPRNVSKPDFETFKKWMTKRYLAHDPNLTAKELDKKLRKRYEKEYGTTI